MVSSNRIEKMSNWYIIYNIPTLGQIGLKAGPYNADEIETHKRDIAGFEGVINVRVVSEQEIQDKVADGEAIVDASAWTD